MFDNKKIGIIILNYNDFKSVQHIYSKIKDYKNIDHIVIVDNLSTDNSYEKLKLLKTNNKTDIIQTNKNGGYSYGNNYGAYFLIDKYKIDVLCIANPDVEFTESFLDQIIRDMNIYYAQAASGFMVMGDKSEVIINKKINSFWREVVNCTIILKKLFPLNKRNRVCPKTGIQFVEWLPGALFFIDSKVFKEIHGLDDNVFLFYEEQILGEKFQMKNYKMIIDTDIDYLHNHSVSIKKSMKRFSQVRQMFKSKYYLYTKYENIGLIKRSLMKVFIFYGLFIRKILYKLVSSCNLRVKNKNENE